MCTCSCVSCVCVLSVAAAMPVCLCFISILCKFSLFIIEHLYPALRCARFARAALFTAHFLPATARALRALRCLLRMPARARAALYCAARTRAYLPARLPRRCCAHYAHYLLFALFAAAPHTACLRTPHHCCLRAHCCGCKRRLRK